MRSLGRSGRYAAPAAAWPLPIRRAKACPKGSLASAFPPSAASGGLLASQRQKTKPMESGPCLSLPLVAKERKRKSSSNRIATELMHMRVSRACERIVPAMPRRMGCMAGRYRISLSGASETPLRARDTSRRYQNPTFSDTFQNLQVIRRVLIYRVFNRNQLHCQVRCL